MKTCEIKFSHWFNIVDEYINYLLDNGEYELILRYLPRQELYDLLEKLIIEDLERGNIPQMDLINNNSVAITLEDDEDPWIFIKDWFVKGNWETPEKVGLQGLEWNLTGDDLVRAIANEISDRFELANTGIVYDCEYLISYIDLLEYVKPGMAEKITKRACQKLINEYMES